MVRKPGKPLVSLIAILLAVVFLDQCTKQWAQRTLVDEGFRDGTDNYPSCKSDREDGRRERFIRRHRNNITVVEGFFELKYVENCASAFGLMGGVPEWFRFPFFLVISILAVVFIAWFYTHTPSDQRLMVYSLPFVLGGAVGNLIDRLAYRYVVDFVDWYVTLSGKERHWPTFNIADAAIVVGIGLMVLQVFVARRKVETSAEKETQPTK